MIPSTHLRIGNWVNANVMKLYPDDRPNYEPAQIQRLPEDAGATHSPIELSTEILEKAGFTLSQSLFEETWLVLQKGEIEIKYYEGAIILGTGDSYHDIELLHIKSVHQLQNLYFSLCGEELEINL